MKKAIYSIYWVIAGLVVLAGSIAYYEIYDVYALKEMAHMHNNLELVMRSLYGAINLFLFNLDTDAIVGWLEHDAEGNPEWPTYLLHGLSIVAALWTILFVVWVVAHASWMSVKRLFHSLWWRKNLYIFWGINDRSIRMAKELNGPNDYTLFIVEPDPKNANQEPDDKDRIFTKGKRRVQIDRMLEGITASVFIAEKRLIDISEDSSAWSEMDIPLLESYIQRSEKVYFLLLGENEIDNINTALRLSGMDLCGKESKNISIQCHARMSNTNRAIEHQEGHYHITIVDSSHIAVEVLKNKVINSIPVFHPIQYVDLSSTNPGTVSSAFRSLIIGFSESGQDALRFLYEFGSFLSDTNAEGEDELSEFHCDVVDLHFGPSARRLINHSQGMFASKNKKYNNSPRIVLHNDMDYKSEEFYSQVLKPALERGLNYVVIALGEDQAGMALAVDILRFASVLGRVNMDNSDPYGTEPTKDRFTIYVRTYSEAMYDFMTRVEEQYKPYIVAFGADRDIYTKAMLINDALKHTAMVYFYKYNELKAKQENKSLDEKDTPESLWEGRRQSCATTEDRLNVRRQESQDYAVALHELTKVVLRAHGASEHRVAQTEHLRWLAAHEIMGFRYGEERKCIRYTHPDMKSWGDLTEDERELDNLKDK